MPQTRNKEEWIQHYREQLREIFAKNSGWYVRKSSKKIRIEIKGDIKQSKTLHFDWSKKGFFSAIPEIQQIYKRFHLGKSKTLDEACEVVKVSDSNKKIDFQLLINEFRDFVPNASEETWNKSYVPVLHIAQELLERSKGKPKNREELLLLSLKKWEQGSRSRQIARKSQLKLYLLKNN